MSFLWDWIASVLEYITQPVLRVDIDTTDTDGFAIAGNMQKICTISITFPYNFWLNSTREEIRSLRPIIYLEKSNSRCLEIHESVSRGEDQWDSDNEVRFDISLSMTTADEYVAHMEFSRKVYFIGPSTVAHTVKPAKPRSIELINKQTEQGHGEGDSVYRGGNAIIAVHVKDEFENLHENDGLNFDITQTTSSVTLVKTVFDKTQRCHVVTIRCGKTGMATFGLSLPSARLSGLEVRIILPAVSAPRSFIGNLDEIQSLEHVAGIPIKIKLVLRDIFGNSFPHKELKEVSQKLSLALQDNSTTNEMNVNFDQCKLEFAPLIAGSRLIGLSIAGQEVRLIKIDVVPGPLKEIQIIDNYPFVEGDALLSYPTEQHAMVVKGIDQFGNIVVLDPQMWHLEITGEDLQNPKTVDGTTADDDISALKFTYTFDRKGKHTVTMNPTNHSQSHVEVPYFTIEVTRPPINEEICEVKVYQEDPIFTGEFRPLQLRLLLKDRTHEKYELKNEEIPYLKVRVDCTVFQPSVKRGDEPNEVYLILRQIEKGGGKDIQVMYNEKHLGGQLNVYIVGTISYKEQEYFKDEGCQNIRCVGVSRRFLIGEDYANINNIHRVLETKRNLGKFDYDVNKTIHEEAKYQVVFELDHYSNSAFSEIVKLLSLLVKGAHHYRQQAKQFDKQRQKRKHEAITHYRSRNFPKSAECKRIKEEYGTLMNKSNRLASDAIFNFYNDNRPDYEIDLHGQLVTDEEQLSVHRQQLQGKRNISRRELDDIIARERSEGDEAIRLLEERFTTARNGARRRDECDWLEIIDGAGHHSEEGRKIRPKVEEYLKKQSCEYIEANQGALLVTFSEYNGKEPCCGNFYCKTCTKSWESHVSWKGYYQKCYGCDGKGIDSKCYPFKLRSSSHSNSRRRRCKTTNWNHFTSDDHRRLCQKCKDLDSDCRYSRVVLSAATQGLSIIIRQARIN